MYLFLAGAVILLSAVGLFWLKDQLQSPTLARLAYSGLVARLTLAGAALCVLGILLFLGELLSGRAV
ncbi:MAG: hypothetical protein VX871_00960 [Pseudomonadota bacterium]|nr:hypothetical protein [Pseudomonadota bacterium]